ncbi:AraC family transcriptional regulator ligand-binding domain-containing protein [Duganella fentianensis]|nr:AraC family transcriptional regulator ligand-binding domain-containing protein [Duganella fentianensis]
MRELGCDPEPLMRRYHIDPALLGQEDAWVSLRAATHLMEASAEATGLGDFGLRLSAYQSIEVLGPLAIVIRNAPTVREALNDVIRYLFVQSPGIIVSVDERNSPIKDTVAVSVEVRIPGPTVTRQNSDLCLADAHNFLRLFAGANYELCAVSLSHQPIVSRAVYERFFATRLLEEPTGATLYISRKTFAANLEGANASFRQVAEDYIFRTFGIAEQGVAERVRSALRRTLGTTSCNKTSIAALLALHPRTLQRRLAEEGVCFELIKDEVRKQLMLQYLCGTRLPLGQIALMLGFPAQSALSRACRLWFNATPMAIRAGEAIPALDA